MVDTRLHLAGVMARLDSGMVMIKTCAGHSHTSAWFTRKTCMDET